ncbi:AtzE family amidohydrolase [Gluconobacter sp. R75690]|uniref:AtzE family amidohydrolase n=1 Tax=Gluconobacter TaxID=441 RepID=UPI001889F516|nr:MULTISPECIES: AtzE family amidohydrolase [unclassified Gluconobacter]MBF0851335.1 AtzE family amidohydrolase [Gluconobacter sp. R75690]MBF0879898.1 AtzE family amidohydrolase [Gluconobacter sp. R75828]
MSGLQQRTLALAASVRKGEISARDLTVKTLADIEARDKDYNCVTRLLMHRALEAAERVDRLVLQGQDPGPLAGVPFGIKDLFDVRGEITTAGSKVLANDPPAMQDATLVAHMIAAGAIPVALTNMDEFAYGFATINAHYGNTRNPHAPERLAGGSSGGSAAGVAARMFSIGLGSDTNGSIRVPASLCGIWGLRATQGRLSVEGSSPFVPSLDTVGPFADSAGGLKACFEALCVRSLADVDVGRLRIARLGGWFGENMSAPMQTAIDTLSMALGATDVAELPEVARARAAAFVISASEGAGQHLKRLRTQAADYDPAVRDRLLAGALLPSTLIFQAHRLRHWFRDRMHEAFAKTDILLAPALVGEAPRFDQPEIEIGGKMVSARANLGLYTQPLTLAGFPVLTVPMKVPGLPLGAQLIARPGREDQLFALAEKLETDGLAEARLI